MTDFESIYRRYDIAGADQTETEFDENAIRPLECTAVHEAGHVVVAVHLNVSIDEASIVPSAGENGRIRWTSREWEALQRARTTEEASSEMQGIALKFAKITLGGKHAELLFHKNPPCSGWNGDMDSFRAITSWLKGSGPSLINLRKQLELDTAIIIERRKSDVLLVAEALLEMNTIDAQKILELLRQ